jgi:cytochrome c peroxidase
MKRIQKALLTALFTLAATGCGAPAEDEQPTTVVDGADDAEQSATVSAGENLFKNETFRGNGRTCATCHTNDTGTLSAAQAQSLYSTNKNHPLFRRIDSDERTSATTTYSKLVNDATITVDITLPPNVTLANDPARRTITLRRGVPTVRDAAALDDTLMWDGREPSLQSQAHSAIMGHAEATRTPTPDQLDSIVAYEKTLFTSTALRDFAKGRAPAPALPAGRSDSEKRGRVWFEETGVCGSCHAGALLNRMAAGNPMGAPAGSQFSSAGVSEFNLAGNPVLSFLVTNPADGTVTQVDSPDPGLMLVTGDAQTAGLFKMTSLRNLKNTAPYFHDNSAQTLDAVMVQYQILLDALGIPNTAQDREDMIAFMKLL